MTDYVNHEAVELELYIMNDYGTYSAYFLPVMRNLARHWRNDAFNLDLGIKGMRHAVDAAAKNYHREYGTMSDRWSDIFTVDTRNVVAEELARQAVDEFKAGQFNATDWK